jgi:hypothetical protein
MARHTAPASPRNAPQTHTSPSDSLANMNSRFWIQGRARDPPKQPDGDCYWLKKAPENRYFDPSPGTGTCRRNQARPTPGSRGPRAAAPGGRLGLISWHVPAPGRDRVLEWGLIFQIVVLVCVRVLGAGGGNLAQPLQTVGVRITVPVFVWRSVALGKLHRKSAMEDFTWVHFAAISSASTVGRRAVGALG